MKSFYVYRQMDGGIFMHVGLVHACDNIEALRKAKELYPYIALAVEPK